LGFAIQQANGKKLEHTPGGGGIVLRVTDALRFAYLLLRNGIPSLDLSVYKMACIGLMDPARYDLGYSDGDASRDNWKPHPFDQFHDGPINGDASTRRTLEMVIASIRE
jgi:hypothetical protein